jgi:ADP-ribose pyrophosphatase
LNERRNNLETARLIECNKVYTGELSVSINKFLANGKEISKELVEYSDSVGIIPLDKDLNLVLIQQYRFAARKLLIEIPAGKIESGETPVNAAIRELNEETGLTGTLEPLINWYLAPGYSTEKMHIFVARDLIKCKKRLAMDSDEKIVIRTMTLNSAVRKCVSGSIQDCKTISAILLYSQLKRRI